MVPADHAALVSAELRSAAKLEAKEPKVLFAAMVLRMLMYVDVLVEERSALKHRLLLLILLPAAAAGFQRCSVVPALALRLWTRRRWRMEKVARRLPRQPRPSSILGNTSHC